MNLQTILATTSTIDRRDAELRVTPDALIPRPETEQLVEAVLAWSRAHLPIRTQNRSRMQNLA